MHQRALSDEQSVRRRHIPTPQEQAAADAHRAKQKRLADMRRTYAVVWLLLVLPAAAAAGWFANQFSLWLIGGMTVSIMLLKPITALAVRDRRPRDDEDDDFDGPAVDIAEIEAVGTGGGPAYVELDTERFDEDAAEEREGQP